MSIFHVFPGLFNRVDIEQVRFSYTCTKSTKQQIEPSLTVDNDNVYEGQKHVHGSEMQQSFGLFSTTFHDFPGSRPNSMSFQDWNLNFKFHDFCRLCTHPVAYWMYVIAHWMHIHKMLQLVQNTQHWEITANNYALKSLNLDKLKVRQKDDEYSQNTQQVRKVLRTQKAPACFLTPLYAYDKPRLCINIHHYAPPRTVLQQVAAVHTALHAVHRQYTAQY